MPEKQLTLSDSGLVDLLDRVVRQGAVINGDVIITLAGVDLVRLNLRLLLRGIHEALP